MLRFGVREIRWTERREEHIARHHIRPAEVEEVIYTKPRLVIPGREGTTCVLGQTVAGRYLFVVLADDDDGRLIVCTARDMDRAERSAFFKGAR